MKLWKSTHAALMIIVLSLGLVACGGGGGSSGASSDNSTTKAPTLVVSLHAASGSAVENISIGGGQTVKATVKDAANKPVSGKLVTFTLQPSSLATLSPSTALTNADGVASISISPASVSTQGAGQIEAQATVNDVQVNGKLDFAVQPVNLSLSDLQLGSNALPSGGNTSISTTALIAGQLATGVPVNVVFTASCGRINDEDAIKGITIPTDGSSLALVSYRAISKDGSLCQGRVNLTASTVGADPKSGFLDVANPEANAINFISASPAQIYVAGSGAQEQSVVTFRVLAGLSPLTNIRVRFSILVNPGGVGLNSTGQTTPVETTTDSKGEAQVSVFSGTIPGPVKVRAELVANNQVFSTTQNLTVASGPPSQRYMSLSVETFNIEGWSIDGSSTRLTVRLADRQGNPVENGTVVNFTTEGGQVQPSCATQVVDGISLCSVNFVSQNPRPSNGRVSVLAYVAGTKDYDDNNQNNKFDESIDTLHNQGDAYRDDNENGAWDTGEFIVPRGGNVTCTGKGAPFPTKLNTCDASLATTVRQQTTILFSSSQPDLVTTSVSAAGVNFNLGSLHNTLLPMPAGSNVLADAVDATNNSLDCSVKNVFGTPIPNVSPSYDPAGNLRTSHSISLKDCAAGDSVSITVRAFSGLATTFSVPIQPSTTPPVVGAADNITAGTPIPSQIFVAGNGLSDQATVTFQVRSGTTLLEKQNLKISIPYNVGGITFNTRGNKDPVTLTTNSSGQVSLTVFAGTIPTPVKIRAELESDPTLFTETQNLTISSGPPSQRYFSLSASKYVLDASVDGDESTITVYVADRQGNAVPDGTVINFTAEGGQIERFCTTKASPSFISFCSVKLVTQNPRPSNGRVSVLAYAEGTKDYIDENGDNQFDSGDTLVNIGDAYRDDDENNVYTAGEFVVSRGVTGGICNSSAGAPFPRRANTCNNLLQTTVRQQLNIVFAIPPAVFTITSTPSVTGFNFRLNSTPGPNLVPMPIDTTVSATSLNTACTVGGIFPDKVSNVTPGVNPGQNLGTNHSVILTCTPGTQAVTVPIRLTATTPLGRVSVDNSVSISVPAAP